jgi:hypothetical protein
MVMREIAKIAAKRAGEASLLFLRHFVCVSEAFIPSSLYSRQCTLPRNASSNSLQ